MLSTSTEHQDVRHTHTTGAHNVDSSAHLAGVVIKHRFHGSGAAGLVDDDSLDAQQTVDLHRLHGHGSTRSFPSSSFSDLDTTETAGDL